MSKTRKNGLRKLRRAIANGNKYVGFNYRIAGQFSRYNDYVYPVSMSKYFLHHKDFMDDDREMASITPLNQIVWSTLRVFDDVKE